MIVQVNIYWKQFLGDTDFASGNMEADNEAESFKNPSSELPAAGKIEEKGMEQGLSTSSKRAVWSMELGNKWR